MQGRVLIIAGSDPSGGAGVQADIKTVTALGGYAAAAITALTVQNTKGVFSVHPV
ncbi:MAG: bifunctional hydroxymethylpyrimidine kinase/phosphomethylpyrimidine kinase, partial [Xanthobacteraceae bacterium]